MEQTENLDLPYIMPAQAQKHVQHNEALRMLDALVQLSVKSEILTAPPTTSEPGDRYIVAETATDEWVGREGSIAAWQDNAWAFFTPLEGWVAWLEDEATLSIYTNGNWVPIQSDDPDQLGINTTPDATNRLSIKADGSLFSHDGTNHRLIINKAAETDSASVIFRNDFAGKAEFGLLGDDDLSLKYSPDGTNWHTSVAFSQQNGAASFPNNTFCENLFFNMLHDGGRFAGAPENPGTSVGAFAAPGYFTSYNGSVFSDAGKFTHNNSTFGGSGSALGPDCQSLMNKLKNNQLAKRLGPEFHLMEIATGSGQAAPLITAGVTRHLLFTNRPSPLWKNSSWGINLLVKAGSVAIAPDSINHLYIDGTQQQAASVIQPADGWKQIVVAGQGAASDGYDFNSTLFKIYAETGSSTVVALPFLTPMTHIPKVGEFIGRVPSIQAWR